MHKLFSIIAAILPLTLGPLAQAQSTLVKGRVMDSKSREGEISAVVQFYTPSSSDAFAYTMTDSLGRFSIGISRTGEIAVSVENMGRKPYSNTFLAKGGTVDLGDILLEDDIEALKGARVAALKTLVKIDADKTTYDVSGDVDAKSGSVLDMLRKVPMVTVDGQDNITVNGSSSFKVYLDGKPNQMMSEHPSQVFKAMPSSAIKSIEVITNPGAKYDAEGTGGVLNLVSVSGPGKASADGIYGSVNAGGDTRGGYSVGGFLTAQKGKWTFSGNISGGLGRNGKVDLESKQTSGELSIETSGAEENVNPNVFGDFSASYELDSLNLFSASFGLSRFGANEDYDATTEALYAGDFLYGYSRTGVGKLSYVGLTGSFDYQHTFPDVKDRTLTLSYRYSGDPTFSSQDSRYSDVVAISVEDRKQEQSDMTREHTFQADFTTPLSDGSTLSTGLKFIHRHNSADDRTYLWSGDDWALSDALSSNYDHYNNIAAAYGEYSKTFGKLSLKGGLRYEHTFQKMNFHDGSSDDFSASYGNLVPSASAQWNFSPAQNAFISYNMRIRRPGISYLNPFVNQTTPTAASYGNPDIDAENRHTVRLGYNFFSSKVVLSVKAGWNHCGNGISSYSFYKDGVLNSTYGNIVKTNSYSLNVFFNWNASPRTRIYASAEPGYDEYRSEVLSQENSGFKGNFLLGAQQTLGEKNDWKLGANLFAYTRNISLQGYSTGLGMATVSVSKSFLDDRLEASLRATCNLSGGKMHISMYSEGDSFTFAQNIYVPINSISFRLQYTFGKRGLSVKKARRTISNDDVVNASSSTSGTSTVGTSQTSSL